MRCLSLFVLLSLLLGSCQSKSDGTGGTPTTPADTSASADNMVVLTVMSYNIKGSTLTTNITKDSIADVIKRVNSDVVLLQEVYNGGTMGNTPAYLAQKAGYPYYYFAQAIENWRGPYGNAILSKYPLTETRADTLYSAPVSDEPQERRVLGQAVIVKKNHRIKVAVMHLDVKSQNSYTQAITVASLLNSSNDPIILGGDANATPMSETILKMKEVFTLMCNELGACGLTFPNVNPTKQIDYLLVGPKSKRSNFVFKSRYYNIMVGEAASDHCPIVGETRITYLE